MYIENYFPYKIGFSNPMPVCMYRQCLADRDPPPVPLHTHLPGQPQYVYTTGLKINTFRQSGTDSALGVLSCVSYLGGLSEKAFWCLTTA
jgi:hypothetical protein